MADLSIVEKVRRRFELVQDQIKQCQNRLEALQAEERDLDSFLRVAFEFGYTEPEQTESKPQPKARATGAETTGVHDNDMLKREPGTRQTEIAAELVKHFKPGDIVTSQEAANRLSNKFTHPENKVGKTHYLSSYLNKEAQCRNGILVRMPTRGHYRVKDNPEQFLQG